MSAEQFEWMAFGALMGVLGTLIFIGLVMLGGDD